jgi:hypothetical protein
MVKMYLAKHIVMALEHLPYSPDLLPPDFFLLSQLKHVLKGFTSAEEVATKVMRTLTEISKKGFQECLIKLHRQKCALPK